jgi:tRNA (guanine26-N2/guanine27-N2)-dimethyltransferase
MLFTEGAVLLDLDLHQLPTRCSPAFYNPKARINRDVAVGVVATYASRVGHSIVVCDALSGSGVRGLRYGLEVSAVERVILNDVNPHACEKIRKHLSLNSCLSERFVVCCEDANVLLHRMRKQFDVVDIDPFGSFIPFLDAAFDGLKWGGLLCVSATDTAVPCGRYPKTCIRHYGVKPLATSYRQEIALRIYVSVLIRRAAQLDMAYKPLLSIFRRHSVALFGIVIPRAYEADGLLSRFGYIAHCFACEHRHLSQHQEIGLCPECGGRMECVGPIWLGELADAQFASDVSSELFSRRFNDAAKLVRMASAEAQIAVPFYDLHALAKLHRTSPPRTNRLIGRLRSLGYIATRTHITGTGVKTDAPIRVIKEAMFELAKET